MSSHYAPGIVKTWEIKKEMGQKCIGITDALLSPLYALFSAHSTVSEISITVSISQKRKLRSLTWQWSGGPRRKGIICRGNTSQGEFSEV